MKEQNTQARFKSKRKDVLSPESRKRQIQKMKDRYKQGNLYVPNQTGFKHSPETKKKISEVAKNHWKTKEYREKYNKSREYMKTDIQYKKKLSEGLKERWANPEFKKKMSIIFQNTTEKEWKGLRDYKFDSKKTTLQFKNLIRKRDNQICVLCAVHREKLKHSLDVHHINYDETLHFPQNCISLCRSCHMKTNFNRKHWSKLFQSLLNEKYGYKYSEEGQIVLEVSKDEKKN